MSIRYFTNNAAVGDGSLYQTVLDAQEGDVVAPDPTVFGAGERVVIDFADLLKIERAITIDAGKTRLIFRKTTASAIPKDILIDCVYSTVVSFNARGIAFNGRVLIGGSGEVFRFDKCVFGGFASSRNSVHTYGNCDIAFIDCAFVCGGSSPFYGTATNSIYNFTRCTIAANKANETTSGRTGATYVDCIDEPDLSTAGFANVPTSLDEVDVMKWEEYDFSPLPSSPYATGATTAAGRYDLDGVERGRVLEDGSTVYALGAYECLDGAFWAGADAEGNPVAPKFNSAEGWSSFRNATKGNLDAPPERCIVINKQVSFTDSPSLTSLKIARASVALNGTGGAIQEVYLDEGGTLTNVGAGIHYLECAEGARYSGWNYVDNAQIKTGASVTIDRSTAFNSLTIEEGATIELSDGALVGVDSPIINGGEVRANKRAYFAIHPTDDATKATFTNVVLTPRGAGIQSFYATANVDGAVKFDVELTDSSIPILIEKHNNDTQEWETLYGEFLPDQEVDINTPQAIALGLIYRACDGANFYVDMTTIPGFLWFTKCWAVNEGGGGGDPDAPTWKVSAWGVDPQLEE